MWLFVAACWEKRTSALLMTVIYVNLQYYIYIYIYIYMHASIQFLMSFAGTGARYHGYFLVFGFFFNDCCSCRYQLLKDHYVTHWCRRCCFHIVSTCLCRVCHAHSLRLLSIIVVYHYGCLFILSLTISVVVIYISIFFLSDFFMFSCLFGH